jgi:hypothetical protein
MTTRCYHCGGSHDARDHDFECKKQHKVVGTCDCILKCFLCKGSGHHAREKGCPVRGDFVPPRLPKAALAVASPAVEDAQKVDAIPFTRPHARPAHKGRGRAKGKGKATESSRAPRIPEAHLIEDICAHNEEELRAYCFCCPPLEVDDYRLLYTNPPESDEPAILLAKGKSAQDVYGECILRKNRGPEFLEKAGTDTFHTTEELHKFLVKASTRATSHLPYHAPEAEGWLVNMPTDEDAGWNADAMNKDIHQELANMLPAVSGPQPTLTTTIKEADEAIGSWKDVQRQVTVHLPENRVARAINPDGSLVTLPARREERPACGGIMLDRQAGATEHVMIINRQAQHMGWSGRADNQFAALAGPLAPPAIAEDPSEVDPNA